MLGICGPLRRSCFGRRERGTALGQSGGSARLRGEGASHCERPIADIPTRTQTGAAERAADMIGIAIAHVALAPVAAQQACESIVGTWRLVSAVSRSPGSLRDNAPYGQSPNGMLIYTADGHMSVMISYGDRKPLSSPDRLAAPPAERAQAFATFFGYAGRYAYSCDRVVHHVETASVPNWEKTDFVRLVKYDGVKLTLITPPQHLGGTVSTFELLWEKAD